MLRITDIQDGRVDWDGVPRCEVPEDKRPVFRLHPGTILDAEEEFCELEGRQLPFAELGFENVVVEDEAGQSAYHVPEGSLILYSPSMHKPSVSRAEVSTLEIAPAILRTLGIQPPPYMVDTRIAA